jgi:hypothetical protein
LEVTRTGTGAYSHLKASARFDALTGGQLQVVLSNISTRDVLVPVDVLTAVFFNIDGSPILTPVSAFVTNGSTVVFPPSRSGGPNVGGEWAYASGLDFYGAKNGVSSSGFGLFSKGNFNGPELQGPPNRALNGLEYGITSLGDNLSTGNQMVTGSQALIKNSVTFTLSGLALGFNPLTGIRNVYFQYGTDLSEPHLIPEAHPLLIWSGLGAVFSIAAFVRRRLRSP